MYYCKNCGQLYADENSPRCERCGVSKGVGTNYCHNCGSPLYPDSKVCNTCGFSVYVQSSQQYYSGARPKSKVTAGILGLLFGGFGVHNFYLGYTSKAVTQLVLMIVGIFTSCFGIGLLLMLGIGIWGFVEGIMILTGTIDADGRGLPLE